MDVTMMLNAGMAAAQKDGHDIRDERRHSQGTSPEPVQTPSAPSALSSMATTPPLETRLGNRSRSRTPWDAGGFSLSRALDARKLMRLSPGAASSPPEMTDLGGGCSPQSHSPRHKFSDSRSSFSSSHTFSSSTNSVSHSRLSSLSTVSENQPLASLITDFSQLETRISVSDPSSFSGCPLQPIQQTPEQNEDFQIGSPTPVRSRHEMLYQGSPEQSPRSREKSLERSPERSLPRSLERPQSPSDAILIPRPGNGINTNDNLTARLNTLAGQARPRSRNHYLHLDNAPKRHHKRAVSAPDFSSIVVSSFNPRFPTFGPIPEPTPSPSQDSDGNAMEQDMPIHVAKATARSEPSLSADPTPTNHGSGQEMPNSTDTNPVTLGSVPQPAGETAPPLADDDSAEPEPVCMYRGDCQTGSQLRKAISHIFGRNKLCTRMIPTGVWVHYCRKHYQRTRYRNGGEYPQRQIGLVQEQIKRVQAWSDANQRRVKGPILLDWSLAVRKREQMRLDSKMAATGKKRPFQEDAEEEEEEAYDEDRTDLSGTAVPDWIVRDIGKDYKTNEILEIVEHLKLDIDQGRLQQIPDIEILPNILPDKDNNEAVANAKKQANKRRPNASRSGSISSNMGASVAGTGHRRTQSVNTAALHLNSVSMDRRRSQPGSYGNPYSSGAMPPAEKRPRIDNDRADHHGYESFESLEALSGGGQQAPPPPPAAGIHAMHTRSSPGGRVQLAHRPAFGEIREGQADVRNYHGLPLLGEPRGEQHIAPPAAAPVPLAGAYEDTPRSNSYGFGRPDYYDQTAGPSTSSTGYGVLPAPNPLRHGGSSVAQRLEISSYALSQPAPRRSGGLHQRSQSEAAFYPRPTSSSGPSYLPMPGFNGNANTNDHGNANTNTNRDQETGYGGYGSQMYGRGSRYDSENRGSAGGQQAGYGNGSESYERYDSVQLPPLQCIPPLHSHTRGGMDRKYGTTAGYSETKHVRHQSSPAVPRMLPSPMEMATTRDAGRPSP